MSYVFGLRDWGDAPPFATVEQAEEWLFENEGIDQPTQGTIEAIFFPRIEGENRDFHWVIWCTEGWGHKRGQTPSECIDTSLDGIIEHVRSLRDKKGRILYDSHIRFCMNPDFDYSALPQHELQIDGNDDEEEEEENKVA